MIPKGSLNWLKREAHRRLGDIWDYDDPEERSKMYVWISGQNPKGHIALMNEQELTRLIRNIPRRETVRESTWKKIARSRGDAGSSSTPAS